MLKRLGSILCTIVFTSVLALQAITINANAFVTTLDSDFHGTWVIQTSGLIFPSGKMTEDYQEWYAYEEYQIDLNTGIYYNLSTYKGNTHTETYTIQQKGNDPKKFTGTLDNTYIECELRDDGSIFETAVISGTDSTNVYYVLTKISDSTTYSGPYQNSTRQPEYTGSSGTLANFSSTRNYTGFSDVPVTAWYSPYVKEAYELNLVNGNSQTTYNPNGDISCAEALALACRIHSIYYTGSSNFTQGRPWYQVYVDYAMQNGILREARSNYSNSLTRAEFADILWRALPQEALQAINSLKGGDIPDVPANDTYAESIYSLYNAGVLSGNDKYGTFAPKSTIKRSEVATIVTRMVKESERKHFTPESKPVDISAITVSKMSLTLHTGETAELTASIWPEEGTNKTVTWASSNPNIATVYNGVVTARAIGTAEITVTAINGKTATCPVTVTKVPSVSAPTPIIYYNGTRSDHSKLYSDGSGFGFYRNSADGICVSWSAINQSGKTVNQYACFITMYDATGSLAYDTITGQSLSCVKVVGPVQNGDSLLLTNDIIGYSSTCTKIVMTRIYLQYSDGTTELVDYGYSGGKTRWDKYWNNFYGY